jgi:hypothetical protein
MCLLVLDGQASSAASASAPSTDRIDTRHRLAAPAVIWEDSPRALKSSWRIRANYHVEQHAVVGAQVNQVTWCPVSSSWFSLPKSTGASPPTCGGKGPQDLKDQASAEGGHVHGTGCELQAPTVCLVSSPAVRIDSTRTFVVMRTCSNAARISRSSAMPACSNAARISRSSATPRASVPSRRVEVLQLQPERIRGFLLQTSILDQLTGPCAMPSRARPAARRCSRPSIEATCSWFHSTIAAAGIAITISSRTSFRRTWAPNSRTTCLTCTGARAIGLRPQADGQEAADALDSEGAHLLLQIRTKVQL